MTASEVQPSRVDQAITLLEMSATAFQERGWLNGGGRGYKGERCIGNMISDVSDEGRRAHLWDFNSPLITAYDALKAMLKENYPCDCYIDGHVLYGLIPHYNDHHCTGGEQAIHIINQTIKHLRDTQG